MKETKQPWPRGAKITVWVLGSTVALSGVYIGALSYKLNSIANSDEYMRDRILIYTEVQAPSDIEDIPIVDLPTNAIPMLQVSLSQEVAFNN